MAKTLKDLVAEARAQINEVSAEELKHVQDSGTQPLLVDVREPAEYAAGHISGAISIPRGIIELSADQAFPKRHEKLSSARQLPVVVYCASGGRSALAALSLKEMGFEHVQSLAGGIDRWKTSGFDLTAL